MTTMVAISLAIYSAWCALNIQQSYFFNKKMTAGNFWNIFFSLLMCYWLTAASVLFLIIKAIDGIFALLLGGYLYVAPGPEEFKKDRGKVINGYWGYAITDMTICFICFVISILGVNHG